MRTRLLRLFTAALTGITAAVAGTAIGSLPASASHSWNGYHWSTSSYPIDLRPINSFSDGFRNQGVAHDVMQDWNQSRKFANNQRLWDNSAATRRDCPYPSGASVRMCDYNWGATGWAGLAQIYLSGSHITKGRARINNYYGTSYNYRRHVLCQEFGHTLGLDHQANGNHSCMDDSSLGWDELTPNGHDYDMLLTIYDHTHSALVGSDTGNHTAVDGTRSSQTVTRLPNGDLLVSLVLWAPDR